MGSPLEETHTRVCGARTYGCRWPLVLLQQLQLLLLLLHRHRSLSRPTTGASDRAALPSLNCRRRASLSARRSLWLGFRPRRVRWSRICCWAGRRRACAAHCGLGLSCTRCLLRRATAAASHEDGIIGSPCDHTGTKARHHPSSPQLRRCVPQQALLGPPVCLHRWRAWRASCTSLCGDAAGPGASRALNVALLVLEL